MFNNVAPPNITDVIPEIHDKITDLEPPPGIEPEAAWFRLFDSVATFVKSVAQSQPLVLVLDDLHWADRPSLMLLQFLARELAMAQSGRLWGWAATAIWSFLDSTLCPRY